MGYILGTEFVRINKYSQYVPEKETNVWNDESKREYNGKNDCWRLIETESKQGMKYFWK